jgi:hypothetical protein
MRTIPQGKLTYANVVSTLCLFLLLAGGAAYGATKLAKNSVGTKQIKMNAVTGAKVKGNSLTGSDINEATLTAVPTATNAANAQTLSGMSATQLTDASKLRCPSGMELAVGVCFESATRSEDDLLHASDECGNAGRRLPSEGELIAYHKQKFTSAPTSEWVGPLYFDGAEKVGMTISAYDSVVPSFTVANYSTNHPYRCVMLPSH